MARKPIIGLKAAEHVGRAVVRAAAVLLTSIQPIQGPDVKRASMLGAVSPGALRPGHVRLIGVLPEGELPKYVLEPRTQRLINTRSSSGPSEPWHRSLAS
jgi:hypothetical protein